MSAWISSDTTTRSCWIAKSATSSSSASVKARPVGFCGYRSPDRVDALVWALTDLLVEPEPGAAMIEFYRLRALEAAEKKAAAEAIQRHPAM